MSKIADDYEARIQASEMALRLAPTLIELSSQLEAESDFCEAALRKILHETGANYVVLTQAQRGRWRDIAAIGDSSTLPLNLLSNVLHDEKPASESDWIATPLLRRSDQGEILVLQSSAENDPSICDLDAFAALLSKTLAIVRHRTRQRRRLERLEAMLQVAGQWNQILEMESLLIQMAEASTKLLHAERASIFLWDRANDTLVGRPALGVEGGELRIPDDSGLVGQVVQTGEARRVDRDAGQDEIDRQVDQQTGYQTRTLLCVPLRTKKDELFGAFEIINKIEGDFSDDDEEALTELAAHASIALQNTQQLEQLLTAQQQIADQAAQQVQLIGESSALEALRSTVGRVADTDLAVLILGENGTGKEVVSQSIHYLSSRRKEPLVTVNCAALTETLLESELFGHEKGAFTDAHETRSGKFELASGGTLFLDEIGDLSLSGQAKLLRVLEEKIVVRVGGSVPIHTDARVIAATNQDLAVMVRNKSFREDLYFRLNVVTLDLPPLRDRGDDIILLAEHFLRDFGVKARRTIPRFTVEAKKRLREHGWPGNVRELRNLMERIAYLSQGDEVGVDDLAFILAPEGQASNGVPLNLTLASATNQFQVEYIKKHIESSRGNMSGAARRLGLHRSNLYRKMRQLGMNASED